MLSILLLIVLMQDGNLPPPVLPPAPPLPGPGTRIVIVTNPTWAEKPSGVDVARVYPFRASDLELDGRAVIECKVRLDGSVHGCFVISETPGGLGFGQATITLSATFKMKPKTADGVPVAGGVVKVPISYRMRIDDQGRLGSAEYRTLIGCVSWHTERLRFVSGDALSTRVLPMAETLAWERGRALGLKDNRIAADIEDAKTRYRTSSVAGRDCR